MSLTSLSRYMSEALALGASDLFLTEGQIPRVRLDGALRFLSAQERGGSVSAVDMHEAAAALLPPEDLKLWNERGYAEGSAGPFAGWRVRFSAFHSLGRPALALRFIPLTVPTVESCGLPLVMKEWCSALNGLILVTGASGSGKSTALAALVQFIDYSRSVHIVTLEDPVEYLFEGTSSMIHQREAGRDFSDFPEGIREALRLFPDVIMIGEMRTAETMAAALDAAETGHLVLATLHTRNAPQTAERIVSAFPAEAQESVRRRFAALLKGAVSLRLVRAEGGGRCLAAEVMSANHAVRSALAEGRFMQLKSLIQTGASEGMQTLEQSLADLARSGSVSVQTALAACDDREELHRLLRMRS